MAKVKTIESVTDQIAKIENEIRQGENKVKRLEQKINQQERNDRTRRLIQRGAILESFIPSAVRFSNEQIKMLLEHALGTVAAKEIINDYNETHRKSLTAEGKVAQ